MWTDALLLAIFHRFPARESIFKPSDGRSAAEYARLSAAPFFRTFGRELSVVAGKDVLDLGSGFGSQAVQYAEAGAATVTGIEIDDDKVTHSAQFAEEKRLSDSVRFMVGKGEDLPLPSNSFDVVTMDDVLEHVLDPVAVLEECYRVLRPGGVLFAKFPPYYCLHGGSHLHGYMTSVPGLNLLFSTRALKSAASLRLDEMGVPWHDYLREEPTDKLWNQNGLTILGLRRILRDVPFKGHFRYIGFGSQRLAKWLYWAFEVPARIPILREIACSRVAMELTKPVGVPNSAQSNGAGPVHS